MPIDKDYVLNHKSKIIKEILNGKVFVYPTDTIYGLGCNALNKSSVKKIRKIKRRETKPFSIIAPSMSWIMENCDVGDETEKYLKKLPGPYTLFLRLKKSVKILKEINPSEDGTIGVRIPKHWFTKIISEAGVPFVTTSVNVSGASFMTNLQDLDETIKNNVGYIIYDGEINSQPSQKIDLTK